MDCCLIKSFLLSQMFAINAFDHKASLIQISQLLFVKQHMVLIANCDCNVSQLIEI